MNKLIVNEMSQNGMEGIVTSHGDIINALYNNKRMTMAEIADKIGKDKSTVTVLIEKLVKLGYVTKERNPEDTRVIEVTLTNEGNELKPLFEAISIKILDAFYRDISEQDKVELARILNIIYTNL
ncbi:MAG: MarR family winged helix-turn-helix transcriptional regulator [Lachnotalea sp.]